MKLGTATLIGGTIGAYAVLIGGLGVAIAVRNIFGPANDSHDDLSTWMVIWRIPLGALIGSCLAGYFVKRRGNATLMSLIGWSILSAVISTFIIMPISLVVIAFLIQTIFETIYGKYTS